MQVFTLITIWVLHATVSHCQEWTKPYFSDAKTTGIIADINDDDIYITMEEELPRPIRLIIVNYPENVSVSVVYPSKNVALLETKRERDKTVIQIMNRQDYENKEQRAYSLEVIVDKTKKTIFVSLTNIFDETPTISYDGPCQANELDSNFNTQCIFEVEDLDGLKDNNLHLVVSGDYNENQLFEFRDRVIISDTKLKYTLYVKSELHYEKRALYNFHTTVYDIANNSRTLRTILEVIDVPNLDPIWVTPFATAKFKEKEKQTFEVQAIDGDTGINKKIYYMLRFNVNEDYSRFIRIEKETGILTIDPINRDEVQQENFVFTIFAYKYDNITWGISSTAVIIVEDINDNYPEIYIEPLTVRFLENTSLIVPLDKFEVNDIDLGDHATYQVFLNEGNDPNYGSAFDIVPSTGYQNTSFRMSVVNIALLDYEEPNWRNFKLKIVSKEIKMAEHSRSKEINVELINWNDEIPIFTKSIYSTSVKETIGSNEFIYQVMAKDRDYGDIVKHKIIGNMVDLKIDELNGTVTTAAKDVFDYERQTTVIIQIEATDTLTTAYTKKLHSSFAQLTINVVDVNDETPELRMPREAPSIMENSVGGTIITDMIQAKDADTDADLEFTILWGETYATKSGVEAEKETYKDCFVIEKSTGSQNVVNGTLKVNPNFKRKIDYEKYEVIYLALKVTDKKQVVNEDSATGTLTVRIEDENDNAPYFVAGTIEQARFVNEEAASDTLIGTIVADDPDGPGFNEVRYSIDVINRPARSSIPNWVRIDEITGAIRVMEGAKIDCDYPKIFNLTYSVTATDGMFKTSENIDIMIFDTNNKYPQIIEVSPNPIEKYENITTGELIVIIEATDLDRDKPHNITSYSIDYAHNPDLYNYFKIDFETGQITAYLQGTEKFDRDNGKDSHVISVNVEDNYLGNGRTNKNSTIFTLKLLDVNDNAPIMPSPSDFSHVISERVEKNTKIGSAFYAPDKDDIETPNAWVWYRILKIIPAGDNSRNLKESDYKDIFAISPLVVNKTAQLSTGKALQSFYGSWNLTIEAFDHGDEWDSQESLSSNETYTITVEPYNFNTPKIIYPKEGSTLRLKYEGQKIGQTLKMADGSDLKPFEAEDPDGGQYGDITFEIKNYLQNDHVQYFAIEKENSKKSNLHITKEIQPAFYHISILATDSEKYHEINKLTIVFVDTQGDPIFNETEWITDFTEHFLNESRKIPEAIDPKNDGIENEEQLYKIYYYIDGDYNPESALLFDLDKEGRILTVTAELDREEIDFYRIRILATNNPVKPASTVNQKSILYINITVNDINDNPPKFDHTSYSGGITTNDFITKPILTVHANDPDLNDTITYEMDTTQIIAYGENIEDIKSSLFNLDKNTGIITLAKTLTSNMKGYFEFYIKAYDAIRHEDQSNIKVYIVSESNRVKYTFLNSYKTLRDKAELLRDILQELYEYDRCNIDDITNSEAKSKEQVLDDNGLVGEETQVRAHFINNSEAIESSEIEARSSDINFVRKLKNSLMNISLILESIPKSSAESSEKTMEDLLTTILGVVTGVLSILCIVLVVTFIMKTKNLNRQLQAFSAPDFGSASSNLNRIGVPTSNIFSVEGSNPVLNNNELNKDIYDDNQSTDSYESDFADINTDPNFIMENDKRDSKVSQYTENTENTYKKSGISVKSFDTKDYDLSEKF